MSCERYKTVIVEAVATGEVGPPLRLHLEGCAECREVLTEQQSLFSVIDRSLSQRMKVSPRPEFLPRIRSAIDLQNSRWSVRTSNVWLRWLRIAGAPAAVCLALLFAVRHHSLTPERPQPVTNALAQGPAQAQVHAQQVQPKPEAAVRAMAGPMKRPAKRVLQIPANGFVQAPEILVPSEERVALAQFVAGLSRRREVALALARPALFEPQPETSPGGPLEIAKLEVLPLIPVNEK
jgi:hypothetical protein